MVIKLKRGDTLRLLAQVKVDDVITDISGWTISACVTDNNKFTTCLTGTILNALVGYYELRADTSKWPVGKLICDVKYTLSNNDVIHTDDLTIKVLPSVTL